MRFFSHLTLCAVVTIGVASCLSACGQKGPLYAPVIPPAINTPYPTAKPKQELPEPATPAKK